MLNQVIIIQGPNWSSKKRKMNYIPHSPNSGQRRHIYFHQKHKKSNSINLVVNEANEKSYTTSLTIQKLVFNKIYDSSKSD